MKDWFYSGKETTLGDIENLQGCWLETGFKTGWRLNECVTSIAKSDDI